MVILIPKALQQALPSSSLALVDLGLLLQGKLSSCMQSLTPKVNGTMAYFFYHFGEFSLRTSAARFCLRKS
jgi:hypothetical protein